MPPTISFALIDACLIFVVSFQFGHRFFFFLLRKIFWSQSDEESFEGVDLKMGFEDAFIIFSLTFHWRTWHESLFWLKSIIWIFITFSMPGFRTSLHQNSYLVVELRKRDKSVFEVELETLFCQQIIRIWFNKLLLMLHISSPQVTSFWHFFPTITVINKFSNESKRNAILSLFFKDFRYLNTKETSKEDASLVVIARA